MGKGDGGKGPPKNRGSGTISRVLGKTISIQADDDDDGDYGEAPAHHADALQKEKGFFTYGGGGYRGVQEGQRYEFVSMEDPEEEERKRQENDWDARFGAETDLRGKKRKGGKHKKDKRKSSESGSVSEDSTDSGHKSKKHKKDKKKKHKKDKKDKKDKKAAKSEPAQEILPGERADKMLVDLLRTGSASATEARQLLTQIDNRQAIITGGISDTETRERLGKFLSRLGLTEFKSAQGQAFTLASNVRLGVKLTRHYSLLLEKYTRNPVEARKPVEPQVDKGQSSPKGKEVVDLCPVKDVEEGDQDAAAGLKPNNERDELAVAAQPFGPAIPASAEAEAEADETSLRVVGPYIPSSLDKEKLAEMADLRDQAEEEQQAGPQAAGQYTMQQLVAFETARALEEERRQTTDRDGWMLTLPEKRQMGGDVTELLNNMPRGFKQKSGVEEESGSRAKWTETPAERERKRLAKLAGVGDAGDHAGADAPLESQPEVASTTVYSRGTGRQATKSLLEQHQGAQKKAKPTPSAGYQPFDRERDLQIDRGTKLVDADKLKSQFKSAFGSSGYEV